VRLAVLNIRLRVDISTKASYWHANQARQLNKGETMGIPGKRINELAIGAPRREEEAFKALNSQTQSRTSGREGKGARISTTDWSLTITWRSCTKRLDQPKRGIWVSILSQACWGSIKIVRFQERAPRGENCQQILRQSRLQRQKAWAPHLKLQKYHLIQIQPYRH